MIDIRRKFISCLKMLLFLGVLIFVSCEKDVDDVCLHDSDFIGIWDAVNINGKKLNSPELGLWLKSDGCCEIEEKSQSSSIIEGRWNLYEQNLTITTAMSDSQQIFSMNILWYSNTTNRFKARINKSGNEVTFLRTLIPTQ